MIQKRVKGYILRHVDLRAYRVTQEAERSERELLAQLAETGA